MCHRQVERTILFLVYLIEQHLNPDLETIVYLHQEGQKGSSLGINENTPKNQLLILPFGECLQKLKLSRQNLCRMVYLRECHLIPRRRHILIGVDLFCGGVKVHVCCRQ